MMLSIPNIENLSREELLSIIDQLSKQINTLTLKVGELTQALELYQHPKNSGNSSIPPSKDENRPKRNQSLREKSGRKPGGQQGHKGTTLTMVEVPDKIEKLIPDYCNCCGKDLRGIEAILDSKRQVVELPPIKPIYIEYQSYVRTCNCGHQQKGDYPPHITNHIQYGPSVEALVGYFSVYQYLPFKRMTGLFSDVFNLPVCQGSIGNLLQRLGDKSQVVYDAIQNSIAKSRSVGGDETGLKVNGAKFWAWIWQNTTLTFIAISVSRGRQTVQKLFPEGFINAILNSDRWKTHITTYARGHQLCFAHLLRDLNYLIELESTQWAKNIRDLFKKAIELKRMNPQYDRDDPLAIEIETETDALLSEQLNQETTPKTVIFQDSMRDYRNYLFPFLYHKDIPPDNNGSERGIRNVKVKMKISGQFKTGHNTFAKLRSVIDTCIKRNLPALHAMQLIAKFNPAPLAV
jgi:transposase